MEARIKEEKIYVYKPIEITLRKEKEAEVLGELLNISDSAFEEILGESPGIEAGNGTVDELLDLLHNMRQVFKKVFTPEWRR